jgi:hypothetical protein
MGQVATFANEYATRQAEAHKRAVTAKVDQAIRDGRLLPCDRARFIRDGVTQSTSATFAKGDPRTEFEAWSDELDARPVVADLVDLVPVDAGGNELTEWEKNALGSTVRGQTVLRELTKTAA